MIEAILCYYIIPFYSSSALIFKQTLITMVFTIRDICSILYCIFTSINMRALFLRLMPRAVPAKKYCQISSTKDMTMALSIKLDYPACDIW